MNEPSPNDAIIYIQILSVINTSNLQLPNSKLNLYLRRSKMLSNSRISIASKQFSLHEERLPIGEVGVALCQKQDFLEIEFQDVDSKTSAYLKLPLQKLLEIPRVKHEIECLLVEKNWDRFFEGPLRNMLQVDVSIISFNQLAAKLVITSAVIHLNTVSSYILLQLQGESKRIQSKDNDKKSWLSREAVEIEVNDLNKSLNLIITAYNQENIAVGSLEIDLVQQHVLIPEAQPNQKTLKLMSSTGDSIGTLTLEYKFIVAASN